MVNALKEKPKEVTLSIKKSPRHYSLQSFNRRPSPKNVLTLGENLKQCTLPKVSTLPFSIKSEPGICLLLSQWYHIIIYREYNQLISLGAELVVKFAKFFSQVYSSIFI